MSTKNWQGNVWEGVFSSFAEVPVEGDVFEQEIWKSKVLDRANNLTEQAKANGAIPAAAMTHDYVLPQIISTLETKDEGICVLDFGGGLGTSYIPLASTLPASRIKEFLVVENEELCKLGTEYFAADDAIKFTSSIPPQKNFDVVHVGSSLHYVEDWKGMLKQFASTGASYMIFADLPAGSNKTFVTAQKFHGSKIPVRFWNLQEFVAVMNELNYELTFQTNYRGYYMDKVSTTLFDNFEPAYRLSGFCQLVFKNNDSVKPRKRNV